MTVTGRLKLATSAILLTLLAGCGGTREATQQDLAFACQISACTCVEVDTGWMRRKTTSPVLFGSDGAAYCPAEFKLERADSGRRSLF